MNAAAAAAFGEIPSFAGCALLVLGVNVGVKAGDSTLRDFFGLQSTQLMQCWASWSDSHIESVSRYGAEVMIVIARSCSK